MQVTLSEKRQFDVIQIQSISCQLIILALFVGYIAILKIAHVKTIYYKSALNLKHYCIGIKIQTLMLKVRREISRKITINDQ